MTLRSFFTTVLVITLVHSPSMTLAAYTVAITTPADQTQYNSGVEFDSHGTVNWGTFFELEPEFINLKVYDVDLTTVLIDKDAKWTSPSIDWENDTYKDDNETDHSVLHAPTGNPPELIDNFKMTAEVYQNNQMKVRATRNLKVKGPVMP